MLSVLRTAPPQHPLADSPKAKFKTVLGLGAFQRDPETAVIQQTPDLPSAKPQPSNSRKSVDAVTSYSFKRRNRQERSSVTDLSFVDPSTSHKAPSTTDTSSTSPQPMSVRRAPLQMDGQDGHWTVSVAENPHDPGSFSLYIKSECCYELLLLWPVHYPSTLHRVIYTIRAVATIASHTREHTDLDP